MDFDRLLTFTITTLLFVYICILLGFDFRQRVLSAAGGLLAGFLYFVLIPVWLQSAVGSMTTKDLPVPPLGPLSERLAGFILACLLACAATFAMSPARNRTRYALTGLRRWEIAGWLGIAWYVVLLLNSGVLEGKHWSESNAGSLGTGGGSLTILLLNIVNITVLSTPLLLLDHRKTSTGGKWPMLRIAALNSLAVATTGNRIFLLGFLLVLFITLSRPWKLITLVAAPLVLFIANLYPIIRGSVFAVDFDPVRMFDLVSNAIQYSAENLNPIDTIGVAFESANVIVLSCIVDGSCGVQPLASFDTLVFRPLRAVTPFFADSRSVNSVALYVGQSLGLDGVAINVTHLGEAWLNGGLLPWVMICGYVFLIDVYVARFAHSRLTLYIAFLAAFYSWRFEFMFLVIASCAMLLLDTVLRVIASVSPPQEVDFRPMNSTDPSLDTSTNSTKPQVSTVGTSVPWGGPLNS
jgi:hypothetical protein